MLDELDLIDEDDQIAHLIQLNPEDGKPYDPELTLSKFFLLIQFYSIFFTDIFKFDPEFEKNELEYEEIRKEIIGDADDEEEAEGEGGEEGEEGGEDEEKLKAAESKSNLFQFIISIYFSNHRDDHRGHDRTGYGRISKEHLFDHSILTRLSRGGPQTHQI